MTLREQTEAMEREMLSPYACPSSQSKGRQVPLGALPHPHLLSAGHRPDCPLQGLRRLKHKTQVFLSRRGITTAPA